MYVRMCNTYYSCYSHHWNTNQQKRISLTNNKGVMKMKNCPKCKGTGNTNTNRKCPACNGNGMVTEIRFKELRNIISGISVQNQRKNNWSIV
jgi:uncharacterized phage protein